MKIKWDKIVSTNLLRMERLVSLFFMSPMLSHLFTVRPTRVKMFALTVRTEVNMFTEQYILPSCHTLNINTFFRHCYKLTVNIKSLILQYNTGSNCALAQTLKTDTNYYLNHTMFERCSSNHLKAFVKVLF